MNPGESVPSGRVKSFVEPSWSHGGKGESPNPSDHVLECRPFLGFDIKRAAYLRRKPELLKAASGMFVVFVGEDFEEPVATLREAERAGYRRFGLEPLYIKQILQDESRVEITRDPPL